MAKITTPSHMKREFECVFLIRHDIDDISVNNIVEKYRNLVDSHGGKVVHLESWGRRRLAYPIEKQRLANYIQMTFFGTEGLVAEIERTMRISDEIVRWLTVLRDRHGNPDSREAAGDIIRREEAEPEAEHRPFDISQNEYDAENDIDDNDFDYDDSVKD